MTNLQSLIQMRDGIAVISLPDLAGYMARKEISIVNAINKIPEKFLRDGLYIFKNKELFISGNGVIMMGLSKRHFRQVIAVYRCLLDHQEAMYKKCIDAHIACAPSGVILKLLALLIRHKITRPTGVWLFRLICYFKKYDPTMYANHGKGGAA